MANFKPFGQATAKQFADMSKGELYRVDISGDDLWVAYLGAFPEGTNPIFRTRTEHDGSYDKSFIRKVGNVVAISPSGELISLWDQPSNTDLEYPYDVVAQALSDLVKSKPIVSIFRHNEPKVGMERNIEKLADGSTREWTHFHGKISDRHFSHSVGEAVGAVNTTAQVMHRGLEEIKPEAVDTVLELIQAGNLYRGDEFKLHLQAFKNLQTKYLAANQAAKSIFVWANLGAGAARIRNSVIGTLLTDLSEGKDLEYAVKSYETKVAPTNYKRPTALITKGMVEQATKTIAELGLEPALSRRHAKLSDVSVNDVLWVDGRVQGDMKGGLTGMLMSEVKATPVDDLKPTPIGIEDFMSKVLPSALGVEAFFSNGLQSNLVSITAPVHEGVPPIFKWENNFGWSYNGNITDSIKERVKAAGGNTNAVLRVSLAWFNHDDLDLHAKCPDGHVYFRQKGGDPVNRGYLYSYPGPNGQILDVDMNAGGGHTRTPVENLSWRNPKDGTYEIVVDQYSKRETSNVGFTLEVENDGKIKQFSYHRSVIKAINAIAFRVKGGKITELKVLDGDIVGQGISQEKWNLSTEKFVKVHTVMLSPNYWDGRSTGNKHWFFVLEGCINSEPTRGIYNEFLKPELEQHRKVFEVLGNKTKCEPTSEQLSGLGFSSTKRDSVIAKVTDSKSTRVYQIEF